MLRSFRLENHRSFRDEAELSLLSAYGKAPAPVPVAAIYGANAAGKSNLLDGLRFMSSAVRDSYRFWDPTAGVPRSPFRLDADTANRESTYVIELTLDGVRHVYGFVVNDAEVTEEWLYTYPRGRRRTIFMREGTTFELGESLGIARTRTDLLSELTRPNALFLSLAAQVGLKELKPVYDWFVSGGIEWSDPSARTSIRSGEAHLLAILRSPNTDRQRLLSLLQAADVGISEIVVQDSVDAHDPATPEWQSFGLDQESPEYLEIPETKAFSLVEETLPAFLDWQRALRKLTRDSLYNRSTVIFCHGDGEWFDLADESAGTRSWLSLLPQALSALGRGGLLVIDEIDSSLHPNLSALLIRQFQSRDTNPHGGQLLFTTHDATLLGNSGGEEVLARDQIWFTEKDSSGASRLYPLTDFHPRTGENRERRYLTGSYGAVPIIGRPDLPRKNNPTDQTRSDDTHHGGPANAVGA